MSLSRIQCDHFDSTENGWGDCRFDGAWEEDFTQPKCSYGHAKCDNETCKHYRCRHDFKKVGHRGYNHLYVCSICKEEQLIPL